MIKIKTLVNRLKKRWKYRKKTKLKNLSLRKLILLVRSYISYYIEVLDLYIRPIRVELYRIWSCTLRCYLKRYLYNMGGALYSSIFVFININTLNKYIKFYLSIIHSKWAMSFLILNIYVLVKRYKNNIYLNTSYINSDRVNFGLYYNLIINYVKYIYNQAVQKTSYYDIKFKQHNQNSKWIWNKWR